jgi:hypothetical protein
MAMNIAIERNMRIEYPTRSPESDGTKNTRLLKNTLISYQSNTESKDNQSFAFFELTLQRKPKYFLLMFYLPFLFLVFLSNLVFLVPSATIIIVK